MLLVLMLMGLATSVCETTGTRLRIRFLFFVMPNRHFATNESAPSVVSLHSAPSALLASHDFLTGTTHFLADRVNTGIWYR